MTERLKYAFSAEGEALLAHLHPTMLRVVRRAMSYQAMDMKVITTLRTPDEEAVKVAQGRSATMNSKHFADANGFARAVDLAPFPVDWTDAKRFGILMGLMLAAAVEEGVKIRCGGNWDGDNDFHDNTPEDTGHFELLDEQPATPDAETQLHQLEMLTVVAVDATIKAGGTISVDQAQPDGALTIQAKDGKVTVQFTLKGQVGQA